MNFTKSSFWAQRVSELYDSQIIHILQLQNRTSVTRSRREKEELQNLETI
jgi:hypothetical protein